MQDNLNGYAIGVGPTIFLNSSVAMELGINYSSTKFKGANDFTTNDFTENNIQFSLGFQIFLEKQ
jgi:opacity protein-like surface antigen